MADTAVSKRAITINRGERTKKPEVEYSLNSFSLLDPSMTHTMLPKSGLLRKSNFKGYVHHFNFVCGHLLACFGVQFQIYLSLYLHPSLDCKSGCCWLDIFTLLTQKARRSWWWSVLFSTVAGFPRGWKQEMDSYGIWALWSDRRQRSHGIKMAFCVLQEK